MGATCRPGLTGPTGLYLRKNPVLSPYSIMSDSLDKKNASKIGGWRVVILLLKANIRFVIDMTFV
jgi:phosphoglycerol transferase MdoB-like AlkP superfamily enzyme